MRAWGVHAQQVHCSAVASHACGAVSRGSITATLYLFWTCCSADSSGIRPVVICTQSTTPNEQTAWRKIVGTKPHRGTRNTERPSSTCRTFAVFGVALQEGNPHATQLRAQQHDCAAAAATPEGLRAAECTLTKRFRSAASDFSFAGLCFWNTAGQAKTHEKTATALRCRSRT